MKCQLKSDIDKKEMRNVRKINKKQKSKKEGIIYLQKSANKVSPKT